MKEIPIKEEHLFKITEFTKRLAELRIALEQADSKQVYEKALRDINRVDGELNQYITSKYSDQLLKYGGLAWGLFENHFGFYIRIGTKVELKKYASKTVNPSPHLDL